MSLRSLIIIIVIVLILIGGVGIYIYISHYSSVGQAPLNPYSNASSTTFVPFNRTPSNAPKPVTTNTDTNNATSTNPAPVSTIRRPIAVLRLLSEAPVGGYGASTTATTTFVRWIDRGRGNIFEVNENTAEIRTLSNTIVPRIYNSVWNKGLTALIGESLPEGSEVPTTLYAELRPQIMATTSANASSSVQTAEQSISQTPYTLKGKGLPENVINVTASPSGNKVFILIKDGVGSIGYIANFDGTKLTRLFSTPLTQINVEWPTDTALAITTKGSATYPGYLYSVNATTGVWTKVVGPLKGLSARVSHDGKRALVSYSTDKGVAMSIYNLNTGTNTDAVVKTLADKCVWGNFYREMAYCAVPFQPVTGTYPDDWYKGTLSTVDKIWQINSATGEIKLIGQLVGQVNRNIDAFNLGLDDKDSYLFFMNKNDLSLLSLDLVRSN